MVSGKNITISTAPSLTDRVFNGMNNQEITIATFMAMSKAFKTTQFSRKNFNYWVLKRNLLRWITSYLFKRSQRVNANAITSALRQLTRGVPQGSIMGPLLFLLCANDISGLFDSCEISNYADDIFSNIICYEFKIFY